MKMALVGGFALAAAVLSITLTTPATAFNLDELQTTTAAVDTELDRSIVLRSVRMPGAFGKLILDMDADARLLDRTRDVANLTDADVWVVGLRGWSDTEWLETSPLHKLFAAHLHAAHPAQRFKSFQWNVRGGQMMDVHFVNLRRASDLSEACLAELVYRLSQRAVTSRRVADLTLVSARAEPLVALTDAPANAGHCD
ncbi:hypothetical protein [Tateyamaria omphalii]|uniref:Uncharacterized protein n=1 Tax=Tateyamaria omphalii TaxID=299262 RepID=A0A1P8MUQ0_9RHOB|nr:hypothetical protein [Tateyamaria omphalii]APX11659.1 hypothetical protein BWR18_08160 [Tateyamaria omphalii]